MDASGSISEKQYKVRTLWFRHYSETRTLLTLLQGVSKAAVKNMLAAMDEHRGTPKNRVAWTDPDTWIAERLQGDNAQLAQRIWQESNYTVNPRYIAGSLALMRGYDLLVLDASGIYRISERGMLFLKNDPQLVREIDDAEGILQLLSILATKCQAEP